jgi:hypothetical protein
MPLLRSTCYTVPQDLERLDVDALDDDDPFELDSGNLPHLFKHLIMDGGRPVRVDIRDVADYYVAGAVQFIEADPARGPAHWLMVCKIDGVVVTVPIVPARSGNPTKCRPIALFEATGDDLVAYLDEEGNRG